jgi:protein TonB
MGNILVADDDKTCRDSITGANASPIEGRSHELMPASVIIFKDLPATFPENDKYQKPSVIGSLIFHGLLIVAVLTIPLLLPQSISERELLVTSVAPIAPPPAPAPPPPVEVAVPTRREAKPQTLPTTPAPLVMPSAIPKEIAKLVEEPIAAPVNVIGGVPGGVPGGLAGGVLGGILSSQEDIAVLPPPLPPPPPMPPPLPKVARTGPIRVGGNVQEPRPIKTVPPVYPALASKARVAGTVVLEATLTKEGTVEAIHVISGHPLLIEAAIAAVKQWQYEPTLLNGEPVSVILTAKVNFLRAPLS